ncbi:MAG: TIGR02391 family protein [Acidobacteriota bacterium]|nr:TIGR02391 family protein [Acidobacteriota bacterium]
MTGNVRLDEILHPRIAGECIKLYLDGQFKHAAREAMTQVELALKERAGVPKLYGIRLINSVLGPGSGVKLRLPFGPETEKEVHALFQAAFAYYRNYAIHQGSLIDEKACLRIMVLATELLELIGASKRSLANIGGVDGLIRHAAFADRDEIKDLLKFLHERVVPEDAPDGFFEDLAEKGYSPQKLDALFDVGLVDYKEKEVEIPEWGCNELRDVSERIGVFLLTPLGRQVLNEIQKAGV